MPLNAYVHWLFASTTRSVMAEKCVIEMEKIFVSFTSAIDIGGHELTHGVTQYEAGLEYWCDPGIHLMQ